MSHGTHEGQPELESASHGDLAVQPDPDRFPVPDPGLEPHLPRLADVDEKAADRATRQVATMFGLVPILSVGVRRGLLRGPGDMTVDFGPLHSNAQHVLFGLTLGLAILLLGMGAIQWARTLMGDEEIIDIRHPMVSTDEARESVMDDVNEGLAETQLTRRKVIGRSLIGAVAALGLPLIVGLADLGPWPTSKVREETIETDHLGAGHPTGQRRHLRPDQGLGRGDRPAGQRPAGEPAGPARNRVPAGEGQVLDHRRPDESEHHQDPRLAP